MVPETSMTLRRQSQRKADWTEALGGVAAAKGALSAFGLVGAAMGAVGGFFVVRRLRIVSERGRRMRVDVFAEFSPVWKRVLEGLRDRAHRSGATNVHVEASASDSK